jgi:hypothetical protein
VRLLPFCCDRDGDHRQAYLRALLRRGEVTRSLVSRTASACWRLPAPRLRARRTSDARETLKRDDRLAFLRRAVEIAAGRPLVFKLHPNENEERHARDLAQRRGLVFARGSAEEMIANCDALVTQYSSTVFVGLALGKDCHSYWDLEALRCLMPIQNGRAARNVAEVCRGVLADSPARQREAPSLPGFAFPEAEAS